MRELAQHRKRLAALALPPNCVLPNKPPLWQRFLLPMVPRWRRQPTFDVSKISPECRPLLCTLPFFTLSFSIVVYHARAGLG